MTAAQIAALLPCSFCGAPPTAPMGEFCSDDDLHEFALTAPFVLTGGDCLPSPQSSPVRPS